MTEKFNIDVSLFNDLFYKTCMYNPLLSGVYHLGGDAIPFLVNDIFSYRRDDKLGFIVHNRDIQLNRILKFYKTWAFNLILSILML